MTENNETETLVTFSTGGQRTVSWCIGVDADGMENWIEHSAPDAVRHLYQPSACDEDILLYSGPFRLDNQNEPYYGDVSFCWKTKPEVLARGIGSEEEHVRTTFSELSQDPGKLWRSLSRVGIELGHDGKIPNQPLQPADIDSEEARVKIETEVSSDIGQENRVDEVTFLVPNGWQGGIRVCESINLRDVWPGRTEASGDGWVVTFDRDQAMTDEKWEELKQSRGRRFTHIGRITRSDGQEFNVEEVPNLLDRIRLGLNLALGRRTACALPVGWRKRCPVWARWSRFNASDYRAPAHWSHRHNAHHQVGPIVSRMLEFTRTSDDHMLMRNAISYYTAASKEVGVEIMASVAVSGLQLLTYRNFMSTTSPVYSKRAWKGLNTEGQLRSLTRSAGIPTSVPTRMEYLHRARKVFEDDYKPDPSKPRSDPFDALFTLVKMRDIATHPGKDQHHDLEMNAWVEVGLLAGYWLGRAALHTIEYQGELRRPFWDQK